MSSRPLIAVSVGSATDPVPYVTAVERAGGEARVLVPGAEPAALPQQARGIVFCGGAAVHPARFGQELDPNIKKAVDEPRDAMEWALMAAALDKSLPILGICRGFQMINVYFGGTLTQNLAAENWQDNHRPDGPRDLLAHEVAATAGRLGALYGAQPFAVNSIHRQGIRTLAPNLTAAAQTADGLIEGYEDGARNIVAVQWHPEELLEHSANLALFEALLAGWNGR